MRAKDTSKRICKTCGGVKVTIGHISPFKKICPACDYDEIQKTIKN